MTHNTETEAWINAKWRECDEAIADLVAAKKERGREYERRIRLLLKFKGALREMSRDPDQRALLAPAASVDPEITALLACPIPS